MPHVKASVSPADGEIASPLPLSGGVGGGLLVGRGPPRGKSPGAPAAGGRAAISPTSGPALQGYSRRPRRDSSGVRRIS